MNSRNIHICILHILEPSSNEAPNWGGDILQVKLRMVEKRRTI